MRGQTVKTPERVAEAVRLRAEGLLQREIADRFGVSDRTINDWLNDPAGTRLAERKRSYAGSCVDCSAPTDGSGGRATPSVRCNPCAQRHAHESATWTRERLIAEARRWRDLTGEWPRSTDWHSTVGGRRTGTDLREAVLEFRALTGPWPVAATVTHVFISWPQFMAAVGGTVVGKGAPGQSKATHRNRIRAALDLLAA